MDNKIYKKLGQNIRKYRLSARLTQQNLADKAKIGLNFLEKIEIAYSKPSFSTIIKISEALNVPLKDLFDFE